MTLDENVPADADGLRTVEEPIERGVVIAYGLEQDLGATPLDHGRFIARTVRRHVQREGCAHPDARNYCPECGAAIT